MRKIPSLFIILITFIIISFTACQSYMFEDAQEAISPIESILKPSDRVIKETKTEEPKKTETIVDEIVVEEEQALVKKKERETLSAIFIPLPSFVMERDVELIAQRLEKENFEVIAFTGEAIVLEKMKEYLSYEIELLENNTLLATNLTLSTTQYPYHIFNYSKETSLALSVIDIRESSTYYEALSGQRDLLLKEEILSGVTEFTSSLNNMPTIIFASLYSPFDSSRISPNDVIDAFEVSHHVSELERGSTLRIWGGPSNISLRSDFLFTHNLIPLSTTTTDITIVQTRKVPSEQRSAISGTFIVK